MIGNVRLHGLGEFERIGGHVLYIYIYIYIGLVILVFLGMHVISYNQAL